MVFRKKKQGAGSHQFVKLLEKEKKNLSKKTNTYETM